MLRFVLDRLLRPLLDRQSRGCMHEDLLFPQEEVMHTQAALDVLCNQDLLKLLFEKLDRLALCSAGQTCRQWRQVAASDEFWTSIDFSGLGISAWQMVPLLQRHPNVQMLDLRGIHLGAALFRQDLPALTRQGLSQLVLGDSLLEEPEGVIASDSVEDVVLEDCHARAITFNCPNMRQLSLKLSNIVSFTLLDCSSLRSLDLQCIRKLNSRQLLKTLLGLGELTSLNMQNQPDLTDDTLRVAATRLGKLQQLLLSGCGGIALNAVRGFPALTFLDLSHCGALPSASAALESFTRLEHLTMNGCSAMTSVALNLPFLRVLSLVGCAALTQITLQCPALRVCDLGSGADLKLKQMHVSSKCLSTICWQGFQALSDIHIACPGLTSVDLSDCNQLGDAIFWFLSDQRRSPHGHGPKDGCPILRQLSMERCEGLCRCELANSALQNLSLADCPNLHTLCLLCPSLQTLNLEECKLLSQVTLRQVDLTTLCLGTCPHLTGLTVSAPQLKTMDLKGCNVLNDLQLNCPSLATLDATFCTQLDSLALSRALTGAPRLDALVLSVCMGLDPVIAPTVTSTAYLSLLDLSYTGLEDLEGIAQCCPRLTSLNISSCRSLHPAALSILFPNLHQQQQRVDGGDGASSSCALPLLSSLDVSYSPLPAGMVSRLLQYGYRFQDIAMNGCSGVTEDVWQHVNAASNASAAVLGAPLPLPQHALQSLSLVGCKALRSCLLGLLPAAGWDAVSHVQPSGDWLAAACHLSALQSLKLGLSGARLVALALPHLTALDMNNCTEIRHLELRCPSLLTAYFQNCGALTGTSLTQALQSSLQLHTLDIQHMDVSADAVVDLQWKLPLLTSVLHAQQDS
ncbi:hypothetical protein ABBQ38_011604 [Trebouxia sp. C0009 RCD-2024]